MSSSSSYSRKATTERPIHLLFLASAFLFYFCFFAGHKVKEAVGQNGTVPVKVGVVLDLYSLEGKRSWTSISMALDDFYAAHGNYSTRVVLHPRDSNETIVGVAAAVLELLQHIRVQAIIGPPNSSDAAFVLALGDQTHVPILSFSVTSPSVARAPYFVRTTLSDSSQVGAIAAIVKSFGWRNVVLIYEDTYYGTGIVPYLLDSLGEVDAIVPYLSVIPSSATNVQIEKELDRLRTMQTMVFVVHMLSDLGSRLFQKAKEIGLMSNGYVWIATDGITNDLDFLEPKVIESMHGTVGVRLHMDRSEEILEFTTRFTERFQRENPSVKKPVEPTIFDLWAYDTTWALAMAVEKAGAMRPQPHSSPPSIDVDSTDLDHLGVAVAGPSLLKAILETQFRGLCGEFRLVNGQLPASAFEIVNVIGKAERVVGYWTPESGIVGHPHSNEKKELKPIIWPGDSMDVPKGWQIFTNGKKLRIGVKLTGFKQFVSVEFDPKENSNVAKGYYIDIFDAVMKALPYDVLYEYIPFQNLSANDLVYQVYLKNFDAVMGDITILANRSQLVDFTLPYTESGLAMIVPLKKKTAESAFIFLKPLKADLWIICILFMLLVGFIVWLFERRTNADEFGGTLCQQLGHIFCFVCSAFVKSPERKLKSMASQIVVIIWAFVVMILVSSYTAMLSSMLTVQELKPTVRDIDDLQRTRAYVGYHAGALFMEELLEKMNFDKSRLRKYSTADQYVEALSKGSDNGGVAAIFDEIPYLQYFLSYHCRDYAMVGPIQRTAGFGFVFQKGSPLVADVSRAILNVTQGPMMAEIKRKWFGDQATCSSQSDNLSSMSLDFSTFSGLFLVSGLVCVAAIGYFIYKNPDEVQGMLARMHQAAPYFRMVAWMERPGLLSLNLANLNQ